MHFLLKKDGGGGGGGGGGVNSETSMTASVLKQYLKVKKNAYLNGHHTICELSGKGLLTSDGATLKQ